MSVTFYKAEDYWQWRSWE